jgi:hypothetical protein
MTAPTPKQQQALKATHRRFLKADLVTRVRMAAPLARELAVLGACDVADVCIPENMALCNHIEDLIGHNGPTDLTDAQDVLMWRSQEAAYALGIAVGQLLPPEVFKTGGGR